MPQIAFLDIVRVGFIHCRHFAVFTVCVPEPREDPLWIL